MAAELTSTVCLASSDGSTACPSDIDRIFDVADAISRCSIDTVEPSACLVDEIFDDEPIFLRGWSMRRGHLKMLSRPKRGKAAVRAELHGQGQQVSRGRSVFKRSLHPTCLRVVPDVKETKGTKRNNLKHDVAVELEDFKSGWSHQWQEDWSEWEDEEIIEADTDETSQNDQCEQQKLKCEKQDMKLKETEAVKKAPRCKKVDPAEALAATLRSVGGFLEDTSFMQEKASPFSRFQASFLREHGLAFCSSLQACAPGTIGLRPAPMSQEAQTRFLDARASLEGKLRPAFHGTNEQNFTSIFQRGLLIPGQGNNLRVAHGSAYGLGVYTAKVDSPSLSRSYCAHGNQILVCAVLDDYEPGVEQSVRHAGSAMVVFDERRVSPVFVASLLGGEPPPKPSRAIVVFNWARHNCLVQRVLSSYPPKKAARPAYRRAPKTPKTLEGFLRRRAARRRSRKGT